jgi:large subunit ribosomal protein LP2
MKYLAAYALLALSGKKDITAADVKKVLSEAQVKVDEEDIERLIKAVKGKPIHQLISDGRKQMSGSVPTVTEAAPSHTKETKTADSKKQTAKDTPKEAPKTKEVEKKKDEKKEEQKEEKPADDDDDFMAGGLFE